MKKYLSMLCCLGVLFTAGCGDDKTGEEEGPTGEAKLTAFSFKAENNPDYLVKDYTGHDLRNGDQREGAGRH